MSKQLTIFDAVGDSEPVSPTALGDTKKQAMQRYLDRADNTACHIEPYNPNGRKTQYYRLKYRLGRRVKTIHINGGNTSARLANYRKQRLQAMIDRGAELSEVLEQLADFNGGTKSE